MTTFGGKGTTEADGDSTGLPVLVEIRVALPRDLVATTIGRLTGFDATTTGRVSGLELGGIAGLGIPTVGVIFPFTRGGC